MHSIRRFSRDPILEQTERIAFNKLHTHQVKFSLDPLGDHKILHLTLNFISISVGSYTASIAVRSCIIID